MIYIRIEFFDVHYARVQPIVICYIKTGLIYIIVCVYTYIVKDAGTTQQSTELYINIYIYGKACARDIIFVYLMLYIYIYNFVPSRARVTCII